MAVAGNIIVGVNFAALAVAMVAAYFAWQSAKAARDAVAPLRKLQAGMTQSVEAQQETLGATQALIAETESTALLLRSVRHEEQITRRVQHLQRVGEAVALLDAAERVYAQSPNRATTGALRAAADLSQGNRVLVPALSAFAPDELPWCARLAEAATMADVQSNLLVPNARIEVETAFKMALQDLRRIVEAEPIG
jgi:hypothetical protein